MREKTPCEDMGYKVGDKFIVLESVEGFCSGQEIKLYEDDGTNKPLFIGQNSRYNRAGGEEGAYLDLSFVKKIGEQEKEMFDMKKQPWFIRVNNKEEFEAAKEWVKENTGYNLDTSYSEGINSITNTNDYGDVYTRVMWCSVSRRDNITCHEIKLTFKTVVDSVEYPVVKSEQQKKVEELEATIAQAQTQLAQLKQQINKGE